MNNDLLENYPWPYKTAKELVDNWLRAKNQLEKTNNYLAQVVELVQEKDDPEVMEKLKKIFEPTSNVIEIHK